MGSPAVAEKAARYVAEGRVTLSTTGGTVRGESGAYEVTGLGHALRCTCPVVAKHQCSHRLAVEMAHQVRDDEQRVKEMSEMVIANEGQVAVSPPTYTPNPPTQMVPAQPQAAAPAAIQRQSLFPAKWEWDCMKEQASLLVTSGFLPKAITKPEQAIAVMLKGRELTIPPMEALSQLFVIDGKVTLQAQLMLALVRRSGKYGYKIIESSTSRCIVEMWPYAHPDEKYTSTFTIIDAKTAGLADKYIWKQYPAQMLRARAISGAARVVCPEIIGGLYTPEELGAEVIVNAEGDVEVADSPQPQAAPPAHDPDTGEVQEGVIEGEWEAEEPAPAPAPVAAPPPARAAAPPPQAAAPAPQAAPAAPPAQRRAAAPPPQARPAQAPTVQSGSPFGDDDTPPPDEDFDFDAGATHGEQARLDEPIDEVALYNQDGSAATPEQVAAHQAKAAAVEDAPDLQPDDIETLLVEARMMVEEGTVDEDDAAACKSPGAWRTHVLRLGYKGAETQTKLAKLAGAESVPTMEAYQLLATLMLCRQRPRM